MDRQNELLTGWRLDDGTIIQLVTPKEYQSLPDGTVLWSIMGERVVKGADYIDDDIRGGFLAYGRKVND